MCALRLLGPFCFLFPRAQVRVGALLFRARQQSNTFCCAE